MEKNRCCNRYFDQKEPRGVSETTNLTPSLFQIKIGPEEANFFRVEERRGEKERSVISFLPLFERKLGGPKRFFLILFDI